MLTYYITCRRKTEDLDSKISKRKNGRLIMQLKCVVCGNFVKKQEAEGLLSNLGVKTPLNKISLLKVLL